jgi:sugar phosphate isomerase/epimerase
MGSAAAAGPWIGMGKAEKRLPIGVSTLGCPKWDWSTIVRNAAQWGFAALELRGIQDQMDLTKCAEFEGTRLKGTLQDLAAAELRISVLGASAQMHEPDPARRAGSLDEVRRFITLAHELKAPYVRVFPDRLVKGEEKSATIARICEGLHELGEFAKPAGVTVIIESHGDFRRAADFVEIMKRAKSSHAAFLWDAHHTCVEGEKPAETYAQLRSYTRHVHLKDSSPAEKGERRYVLTGEGQVPVRETVRVLVQGGYQGVYCLEWEKRWHPEIEEPETAFPQFAKVMGQYLA